MSEWINAVSDWIQANMGWAIAIGTSSTFVGVITYLLSRLLIIKVQSKATAKNNHIIANKYEELKNKVDSVVETLQEQFKLLVSQYSDATEEKFAKLMEQYQKTKQAYLNSILETKVEPKEPDWLK